MDALHRDSLLTLMKADAIPLDDLRKRGYTAPLNLVQHLLGVIPSCDHYLEIWPTCFRTYNLLVPNLLNLPFSLMGLGASKRLMSLAMYAASRASGCPYCTSHTCTFALRRGLAPEKIQAATWGSGESFTPKELSLMKVATALGSVPCTLNEDERAELQSHFSAPEVEWFVLAIGMMGFLNKVMDALGVPLEIPTYAETANLMGTNFALGRSSFGIEPSEIKKQPPPAKDSLLSILRLLRNAPQAISLEKKWTKGVPSSWPAVGDFLKNSVGHDFPILGRLTHTRARVAIATALRDNLDPLTSVIGIKTKLSASAIFTATIENQSLSDELRKLALYAGASSQTLDEALHFARTSELPKTLGKRERAIWELTLAASLSPTTIDAQVITSCTAAGLKSGELIELVGWLGLLQLLHRVTKFYAGA